MDWELYDRQRATFVFAGVALFSSLLLLFRHTSTVVHLRSALVVCTLPSQRAVSWLGLPSDVRHATEDNGVAVSMPADVPFALPIEQAEQSRRVQTLQDENSRLARLLELKENRWPKAVAARVIGRDPQRWFQEIVINKGRQEGLRLDQPVIALAGNREALIGRVIEVGPQIAKVMLIHDSLSASLDSSSENIIMMASLLIARISRATVAPSFPGIPFKARCRWMASSRGRIATI